MTRHLETLAAEHGIDITWTSSWRRAEAYPQLSWAVLPTVRRPSDYLIALHELGHIASAHAQTPDFGGPYCDLLCEGASWAWAAEHALPSLARHLRAEDWNLVGYAFRSYLKLVALTPPGSSQDCPLAPV